VRLNKYWVSIFSQLFEIFMGGRRFETTHQALPTKDVHVSKASPHWLQLSRNEHLACLHKSALELAVVPFCENQSQ
jgi:hypothetical protein